MDSMRPLLARGRRSTLIRGATWALAGNSARICLQLLYFVLLARTLGVTEYGAFIGVVSFVAVASPFAAWGAGNLLVKSIARDPATAGVAWRRALRWTGFSGPILVGAVMASWLLVLPPSLPLILVFEVTLADLLCARVAEMGAQAFQAVGRLDRMAILQSLGSGLRLVGLLVVIAISQDPSAVDLGAAYLGATLVQAAATVAWVHYAVARPGFSRAKREDVRDGFFFSANVSLNAAYMELDKSLLARLSSLEAAGAYGTAQRIVELGLAPVRSLLTAAYSRFFQVGAEGGTRAARGFALRLAPPALAYAVLLGIVFWMAAPLLPAVLGADFLPSVDALRWLAVLPLLRTISSLAGDALTGSDRQGLRTAILLSVAAGALLLNLWFIPRLGWQGAASVAIGVEVAHVVLLLGCVAVVDRHAKLHLTPPKALAFDSSVQSPSKEVSGISTSPPQIASKEVLDPK
jgi:O-antigen/teichoic acid export membrane protein